MPTTIDLHVHTCHSDGLCTPTEVVAQAAQRRLHAIAIADHDSVSGIDEAIDAGNRLNVEVIPAVELSVQFEGYHDVHLLGYLINHRDATFGRRLAEFRRRRQERGRRIIDRINEKLGEERQAPVHYDDIAATDGSLGRPHIARLLMARGIARDMQDAFNRYLVPCDVPKEYFPMDEAISEIVRIGGIPVLAHPHSIT